MFAEIEIPTTGELAVLLGFLCVLVTGPILFIALLADAIYKTFRKRPPTGDDPPAGVS